MAQTVDGGLSQKKFDLAFQHLQSVSMELFGQTGNSSYSSQESLNLHGTRLLSNQTLEILYEHKVNVSDKKMDEIYFQSLMKKDGATEESVKKKLVDHQMGREKQWQQLMEQVEVAKTEISRLQFEGIFLGSTIFVFCFVLCFVLIVLVPKRVIESGYPLRSWTPGDGDKTAQLAKQLGQGKQINYEQIIYAFVTTNLFYTLYEVISYFRAS